MSRVALAFSLAFSLVASLASTASARVATVPHTSEMDIELPPGGMMPARMLTRAAVRAKLVERRAANLARFRAYQKAGVFPRNTYQGKQLNVWIDEAGHLCAAATIIKASGQDELVQRVGEQTNFLRLADVKQGPLMNWILTSGLTQEEIVAIQKPFSFVGKTPVPDLETAEHQRLAKLYQQVEAQIVKGRKASIEIAVSRVMKHPELAWQLIDS
jgi:hypothetical protein